MKGLRIGLDIDDVLADFMGAYHKYFDTAKHPEQLEDSRITKNVQNILRKDRTFWTTLPVLNFPDFVPELFCTKRVNSKNWTKYWLLANGFPNRPVYQMVYQHGNKADMIKGKVDVFIDDSLRNVEAMNKAGVLTFMFSTERNQDNPYYKIYELTEDAILESYRFVKEMRKENLL